MSNVALIDADILCYISAIVSESDVQWSPEDDTEKLTNPTAAREVITESIRQWTKAAKCKRHVIVLSDRSHKHATFRYGLHPHYKAQRKADKPALHDDMVQFLRDNYTTVWYPGLEGDDVMGLLATGPEGNKYTVVSNDKDMLTAPCRQFNPDKDKLPRKVTLHQADYNWMYQTIAGDAVDNYKGAPGAGPVRAKQALAMGRSLAEWWPTVLSIYEKQLKDKRWGLEFVNKTALDEAIMNARCARILRFGDYDFATKQVHLWTPEGTPGKLVSAQQEERT